MDKKIYVIGIGMNGGGTLTRAAEKALENADVIIGAKRVLGLFVPADKPTLASHDSGEIAAYIKSCGYKNIAVLMSGDCGFFSGADKLLPLLEAYDTEVICGISSPVYFCSKLKASWSDLHFVSLHGRESSIARQVLSHEKTFFLLGGSITAADVCKRLCEYGLSDVAVHIGENLGGENERIVSGRAAELTNAETARLCVLLAVNPDYEKYVRSCIPDGGFIRGSVPMTKAEVRGVSVMGLEIAENSVCWDIGAGTGSVSVEMALRCPGGKVYAVERKPEAAMLIDENRHKFKCDNIEIIEGEAPEALSSLPAPDCVFIGGSGGSLRGIIAEVCRKNRAAKITVTAVSLETLSECALCFEELGLKTEITQLAVTRTKKIGGHTMLAAENPIFIIKGILP